MQTLLQHHTQKLSADHYLGCMLGGGIGDALGAPIEFDFIGTIRSKYGPEGISGYVEYADGTGAITDDTQMTLFTAEGLLRAGTAFCRSGSANITTIVYQAYLRWLYTQGERMDVAHIESGIYDLTHSWLLKDPLLHRSRYPGNSCLSALRSGRIGSIQRRINDSKGCGAVMRMAPVGLALEGNPQQAFDLGNDLGAITHGHPSGYLPAGFLAALISLLAAGEDLPAAVAQCQELLTGYEDHEEMTQAVQKAVALAAQPQDGPLPELIDEQLGGGWVGEEALAIALFCSLRFPTDFRAGVLAAANISGDCDSTAAVAGNILGLICGLQGIPSDWASKLREGELLRQMAQDLHSKVLLDCGLPTAAWEERYPGY